MSFPFPLLYRKPNREKARKFNLSFLKLNPERKKKLRDEEKYSPSLETGKSSQTSLTWRFLWLFRERERERERVTVILWAERLGGDWWVWSSGAVACGKKMGKVMAVFAANRNNETLSYYRFYFYFYFYFLRNRFLFLFFIFLITGNPIHASSSYQLICVLR